MLIFSVEAKGYKMSDTNALKTEKLTKKFGDFTAVDNLNLTIRVSK